MSLEKAYGIYQQFKQVQKQVANIQDMYDDSMTTNFEVKPLTSESLGFEEAAYELLDFVKEFVSKIEDTDTNLDPELTKLMGVANLFEGHPATDYVNNAINEVYNSQGICANAPCKAEDKNCCMNKNDVKDAILRVTNPVEPFVRPNPTCKLVCTRNHCSCEDGW